MSGVRVFKRGDTYFIEGMLNEDANMSAILAQNDPVLRLNFKGVKMINSLGLSSMIRFGEGLADRRVEFLELSPVIVDAVNIVPLIVGGQKKVSRIKSVIAPLTCKNKHPTLVTIQIKDLKFKNQILENPFSKCERCNEDMQLDGEGDPQDYFFFLTNSDD